MALLAIVLFVVAVGRLGRPGAEGGACSRGRGRGGDADRRALSAAHLLRLGRAALSAERRGRDRGRPHGDLPEGRGRRQLQHRRERRRTSTRTSTTSSWRRRAGRPRGGRRRRAPSTTTSSASTSSSTSTTGGSTRATPLRSPTRSSAGPACARRPSPARSTSATGRDSRSSSHPCTEEVPACEDVGGELLGPEEVRYGQHEHIVAYDWDEVLTPLWSALPLPTAEALAETWETVVLPAVRDGRRPSRRVRRPQQPRLVSRPVLRRLQAGDARPARGAPRRRRSLGAQRRVRRTASSRSRSPRQASLLSGTRSRAAGAPRTASWPAHTATSPAPRKGPRSSVATRTRPARSKRSASAPAALRDSPAAFRGSRLGGGIAPGVPARRSRRRRSSRGSRDPRRARPRSAARGRRCRSGRRRSSNSTARPSIETWEYQLSPSTVSATCGLARSAGAGGCRDPWR